MSLVTTPRRSSPVGSGKSSLIAALCGELTGPPIPIRNARCCVSGAKETLPAVGVPGGGALGPDGGGPGALGERAVRLGGDRGRGLGDPRCLACPPPARRRGIEGEQLQRRRRDRGRVVVQRDRGELLVADGPRRRADA